MPACGLVLLRPGHLHVGTAASATRTISSTGTRDISDAALHRTSSSISLIFCAAATVQFTTLAATNTQPSRQVKRLAEELALSTASAQATWCTGARHTCMVVMVANSSPCLDQVRAPHSRLQPGLHQSSMVRGNPGRAVARLRSPSQAGLGRRCSAVAPTDLASPQGRSRGGAGARAGPARRAAAPRRPGGAALC